MTVFHLENHFSDAEAAEFAAEPRARDCSTRERQPVDIVVVGAARRASPPPSAPRARAGATLLLDQRPAAGGTGGFSGLTTLCGLFDDAGNFLNDGFAREFAGHWRSPAPARPNPPSPTGNAPARNSALRQLRQMGRVWVLPYRPEKFREVAARLLAATPNLQAHWNTPLNEVDRGRQPHRQPQRHRSRRGH